MVVFPRFFRQVSHLLLTFSPYFIHVLEMTVGSQRAQKRPQYFQVCTKNTNRRSSHKVNSEAIIFPKLGNCQRTMSEGDNTCDIGRESVANYAGRVVMDQQTLARNCWSMRAGCNPEKNIYSGYIHPPTYQIYTKTILSVASDSIHWFTARTFCHLPSTESLIDCYLFIFANTRAALCSLTVRPILLLTLQLLRKQHHSSQFRMRKRLYRSVPHLLTQPKVSRVCRH